MNKSDEIRELFSERLKQALAHNGKDGWGSGAYLKKITGVTQKAANNWLNGLSIPNKEKLSLISKNLGVSSAWLEYGEGQPSFLSDGNSKSRVVSSEIVEMFYYPIIEWEDIDDFLDEHLSRNNFKKILSAKKVKKGFWLEVKDDLMNCSNVPSFPKGSLILINTNYNQLENNQFLIIELSRGEKVFRQIVRNSNNIYLKTLNEKYLPILTKEDECKVIGQIIDLHIKILV